MSLFAISSGGGGSTASSSTGSNKQNKNDFPKRSSVKLLASRFAEAISDGVCNACNGYYGPAHGQSVCPTCHAFLYANDLDLEVNVELASVERDGEDSDSDHDSGNDEPEFLLRGAAAIVDLEKQLSRGDESEQEQENLDEQHALVPIYKAFMGPERNKKSSSVGNGNNPNVRQPYNPMGAHHHLQPIRVESLSHQLSQLSLPRNEGDSLPDNVVDLLPPEVLMGIFKFLDDISLFAVGHVCRRWHQLLASQTTPEQWFVYTRRRWPLFSPMIYITDWFATYSALIESSFCLTCIYQMAEDIPDDLDSQPLRQKRLGHDLRGLLSDASEGIRAKPLDSSYYHWQASITGPVGSPYEGGIFFLYLKVPFSYPFNPPEVRFLTRIFHPNVSRHGDIGIDSIQQHNWVSGLTIPKVLISIQSLLTDPFTDVCMEPEIGNLYVHNRSMFDAVARQWTWKYAMWDALSAKAKR